MVEVLRTGNETLLEKEKLLVTSNFSFSHGVFKDLSCRHVKTKVFFATGLKLLLHVLYPARHLRIIDPYVSFCLTTELTHYQMTNFRLFQTERVCRQQFQIGRKWKKVIQMGRKHCGKRRNCSLQAISPFPTVFSKGLIPRGVKRCHCVGIG